MYKDLIFDDFFNKDRQSVLVDVEREIALSLITPNQVVSVETLPNNQLCQYHLDLSLQIISDIYKIAKPSSNDRKLYYLCLMSEIAKYIKDNERNFIIARYIISNSTRAAILEFPYYITPRELDSVKELKTIYEYYNVRATAIIHNYDPIDNHTLVGKPQTFGEDQFRTGLEKALQYLEENKCIVEYQLNAPKEYILK